MPTALQDAEEQLAGVGSVHYGVRAWESEEDGVVVLLGHPPRRRALAATRAFCRTTWGAWDDYLLGDAVLEALWVAWDRESSQRVPAGTAGALPITVVLLGGAPW